ncbi:DUF1516 family protein [Phocicoccus pinnipedialis]|uniref:Uncharacterized protein n=1 Tax=Phocicoccus pinnipedialis TaxID=110845 RepID=A0A6V7R8E0_9BACL|nr:DUF1516 family protein [Jeotgalicoccus pinnipedialis]MBP1938902.1 putative membrane protein SirB2 [Jeotgalicoccus pinnipedialis]CAD2073258.1 hypothetical protein JEOPIN946_00642 [Jeotgalicoccus pinnipedialis]
MIHLHLTAIFIAVILYIITLISYSKNPSSENKNGKIMHMVLRVVYLLILFSGLMIYVQNMDVISALGSHMMYGIKVLCGLFSIALMEMSLVKLRKSGKGGMWLVITIGLIVVTFLLGAVLPLGTMAFN